jgi:hypothetical protein
MWVEMVIRTRGRPAVRLYLVYVMVVLVVQELLRFLVHLPLPEHKMAAAAAAARLV